MRWSGCTICLVIGVPGDVDVWAKWKRAAYATVVLRVAILVVASILVGWGVSDGWWPGQLGAVVFGFLMQWLLLSWDFVRRQERYVRIDGLPMLVHYARRPIWSNRPLSRVELGLDPPELKNLVNPALGVCAGLMVGWVVGALRAGSEGAAMATPVAGVLFALAVIPWYRGRCGQRRFDGYPLPPGSPSPPGKEAPLPPPPLLPAH